jgi:hypothetical protein
VYRENDRVTVWVKKNWRDPHADDHDLWFAMTVARFVGWPETLAELGYPVPWHPMKFLRVVNRRKGLGLKVWTGAYMIRAESLRGVPGRAKELYQAQVVFTPLWQKREMLRPKAGDTLNSYHMLLGQFHGFGSFLAGQVVADLKHVEPLRSAIDWDTFACSGPGSRRGLNRVLGRPAVSPWAEDEWRLKAERLREWFNQRWEYEPLDGQDFQNVLCEVSKMEKVRLGEGRPRAYYHPHEYPS